MIVILLQPQASPASGELLVAYGGHNETMAPMWVGVDRGLVQKARCRSASVADPQRPDHDGDPGVGWRPSGLGGADQRHQRGAGRNEARVLRGWQR